MKITRKQSIGEFAAVVSSLLQAQDVEAVLTGGAVVSIYTDNKYESFDIDFISNSEHARIAKILLAAGFKEQGKNFSHPDTNYFVEFPPGPLSVGRQQIAAEGSIEIKGNKLKLLSPTQSVMDRLAAFFFWNDKQALDQALWVAEKHPIKLEKIRAWAKSEDALENFAEFMSLLKKAKS